MMLSKPLTLVIKSALTCVGCEGAYTVSTWNISSGLLALRLYSEGKKKGYNDCTLYAYSARDCQRA